MDMYSIIICTFIFYVYNVQKDSRLSQKAAVVLSHGFSTASSIADAANRFTLLDPRTGKEAMDLNRIAELNPNQHDLNILWSIHNDNRAAITTPLDRFVEDGSYLRISTITLGYTFPKKWLSKAFISNLRLYCTLNNPFTITNYSGYDPEVSKESSILTPGIDDSSYPRSKGFVFGINLSL